MCSPGGFVFVLIATFSLNCLHFGIVAGDGTSNGRPDGPTLAERRTGAGLHIDITRKHHIHLNGIEIDEHSLVDHLRDHERELIFGKSKTKRAVRLVHLRHLASNGAAVCPEVGPHSSSKTRRVKRSGNDSQSSSGGRGKESATITDAPASQEVSVQIQDDEGLVNLKLRQTPRLIDDAFIFIRRYANSTQFIEDSHKLAEKYERCFYSNENSALDLCDGENVRGVFHHNSTDYIIHPLPARFGNSTHIILTSNEQESRQPYSSVPESVLDSQLQFEPEEEDFNELSVVNIGPAEVAETSRPTRNSNYTNYASQQQQPHYQQNQHHHHRNGYGKAQQLPLNLRYKPHSHQQHQHEQQQKQRHHHYRQHHQIKYDSNHRAHQQHGKHKRHHNNDDPARSRQRRYILSGGDWKIPQVLHIETAIFVDSDLFRHMAKNFPTSTEDHLIRFVLAMINGVQLLYNHPSLGRRVNFVLKRLEILYKDPEHLMRSRNIDTYLSNFCLWQKNLNPVSDADTVHYDHAVILTGLDLFVLDKNNKEISQVVGLAPVAGMCTSTSSCTINEGKHFESVFVVAHEIGHNLGMRHDTNENSCDSSLYIMSPTLGSGKITWSKCSRTYLETFLQTTQARCLFDRGQFIRNLDHSAEGLLPGERFDANQQCMLKYGRDSVRAPNQVISDICRDLHCQRDRYTWTSHPALEGTVCGENMWCRSGVCVLRPRIAEAYSAPKQVFNTGKPGYDKANFLETSKMGHLLHEYNYNKPPSWGDWGEASKCDSGCLYGPSKRLREGSTGLKTYSRSCLDYKRRCLGRDRKFESCIAKQCYSIPILTTEEFATQICERAQKFDAELTGEGHQIVSDIEESCKVGCKTKANTTKFRSWTFPDGTTCHSNHYSSDDTSYCIAGRCEKFSCDNTTNNYYKIDSVFCQHRQPAAVQISAEADSRRLESLNHIQNVPSRHGERGTPYRGDVVGVRGSTSQHNKYENEVTKRKPHEQQQDQPFKRKSESYQPWGKYNYHLNDQPPPPPPPPVSASLIVDESESEWVVKSGCHSSCMAKSMGIQVVTSRRTGVNNIQLCTHSVKPCERLLSPTEHAENTCARYKLKVRGLSGYGTQIAASIEEPDRSCRVGCQDEFIKYRFYLVNGKYGHFPLGTKCSHTEERYCVNGKCLEFGADNIPLQQSHISLALFRNRRSLLGGQEERGRTAATSNMTNNHRKKRSYLYYNPVNITETITQDFLNSIIKNILSLEQQHLEDDLSADDNIEFTNPIHISTDELSLK